MPTYRKVSENEVISIANRLRYEDRLDLDALRDGIKKLFGETAHKAVFQFDNEYNDESYDLRPTSVVVTDAGGVELTRQKDSWGWDDALSDFFYSHKIRDTGQNESLGEVVVFINSNINELDLPDLYVKVE